MKPLGEAAMDLPWLSPCAHSLLALARSPIACAWEQLRADPGLVLLICRAGRAKPILFDAPSCDARVLAASLRYLRSSAGAGFVNWAESEFRDVYHACLRQAHLASALAVVADCDPRQAWVGGLLAPLGWLAACTIQAAGDMGSPVLRPNDRFDPAAVARRLSRRWRLPAWLATLTGHLGLTVELASRLGAEPRLFEVVQLAVLLRQREATAPHLPVGAEVSDLLASLQLSVEQVEKIVNGPTPTPSDLWESPASQPLLMDVLELAQRNRRRDDHTRISQLHQDVDRLQEALETRRDDERRRVQALKLSALAEFAAGAGHEINNPLAVISGQAQYLLRQLEVLDGPAEEIDNPVEYLANLKAQLAPALHKIVGQTQRIHGILTDLMQFARPTAPRAQPVDVGNAIQEVAASLQPLADERGVRLVCAGAESSAAIQADPSHVRASLTALLRNAIEAAPMGGWAGIRVEREDSARMVLVVEDSGAGPGPLAQEHLFDPFFSGRSAGRGRGMGLPTAWRLACQQDGDVRFDGTRDGVTRFSLILPAAAMPPVPVYTNGRNGSNGSAHHSE